MNKSIFSEFTGRYALSKTLRFELKPIGETLDNMRKHLKFDEKLQTFFTDQNIENAYLTLKPIFDSLHEEFISESLESEVVQKIDFTAYFEKYRNKKDLKDKDFESAEKILRSHFARAYESTGESWKKKAGKKENDKDVLVEDSFKVLTEKGILEYIEKNAGSFSKIKSTEEIKGSLSAFEGFFTYFVGFNQNRENYYETGKEAATAVASRIVHENLPKFCDNALFFENRSKEYKNIHSTLQKLDRKLVNKEGKKIEPIAEDIFGIRYFSKCLSQKQIETYNEQVGDANFLINLYNQAKREEEGFKRLSFFKALYKQIGCGKKQSLFYALTHDKKHEADKVRGQGREAISVEEVLSFAAKAGGKYFGGEIDNGVVDTVPKFLEFIKNRENYFGIYWSKAAINTISNKYFANWHDLKDKLKEAQVFKKADKGSEEDVKIPEAVELEGLFEVLNKVENWKDTLFKTSITADDQKKKLVSESVNPSQALIWLISADIKKLVSSFLTESDKILKLNNYKSSESREEIKSWLDDALAVSQMLKYFLVKESKAKGEPVDSVLANSLDILLRADDATWFKWYDGLRNYLTKKPQDDLKENKLKLNFENSTLAAGWDINKEPDNYCALFRNAENKQFLGIIVKQEKQKGFNKIFEKGGDVPLYAADDGEGYRKMEYKLLPGPNKMLPKCLLPKSDRKKYGASDEILDIYENGSFKKNEENFSTESLRKLVDFYKSALNKYEDWKCFNFSFKPTSEYKDISQFYSEVEKQGYKLNFVAVNKTELDKLVTQGKIYLFEIKNQDSNSGKKDGHKNNLHTSYWKTLFENIENRPKLNGEAEIFYRKALPTDKIKEKYGKDGKKIIENFRFSKEKFLFHVPITLNFCLKDEGINNLVKEKISQNKNVHFLGIDRGEKHLAYFSLVDINGQCKEEGTLNISFLDKNGKPRTVKSEKRTRDKDGKESVEIVECKDYNDLLEARAGDRDFARKNWQTIGTIKELKDGYVSQVVRKIVDLAVKNEAFIVLEDLNTGFKRGRQKIEKSVYQKLELALAKKLNFLVDKTAKDGEFGSVTKALQLSPPVSNYGDIENRKQLGIMLYTRADYTSQTDPVTGWRKSIYLKKGSEENVKTQITKAFSDVGFDGKDYFFAYVDKNSGKEWKLYSGQNGVSLDRFRGERGKDKNEWVSTLQDVVRILDEIFVNFDKKRSLLSQILDEKIELVKINQFPAWESLRFAIDMIQQIRNTGIVEKDADFILSPVRNEKGEHFDSREAKENLPTSGDSNGAYNIARKGIIVNEHIKRGYKLYIHDLEWDAWLAGDKAWEKYIKDNEKGLKLQKAAS